MWRMAGTIHVLIWRCLGSNPDTGILPARKCSHFFPFLGDGVETIHMQACILKGFRFPGFWYIQGVQTKVVHQAL